MIPLSLFLNVYRIPSVASSNMGFIEIRVVFCRSSVFLVSYETYGFSVDGIFFFLRTTIIFACVRIFPRGIWKKTILRPR